MNTILESLLVFNNADKLKQSHVLVVGICWSMNELDIVVIHLAQKYDLIVQLFAIHLFSFLSQSHERQIDEVQACALWNATNCDIVGVSLLKTMLMITPNPIYGMGVTPTTQYPSISPSLSHLFLQYAVDIVRLCTIFQNLEVGWAS